MLPKPLYNRMRASLIKRCKEYADEVRGKNGLAAIPISISPHSTKSDMEYHARELGIRMRIQDYHVSDFLSRMEKEGILKPHPYGGYMGAKETNQVPPKEETIIQLHSTLGIAEAIEDLRKPEKFYLD